MATSNSSNDISKKDYVFAITIIGLFFFIFGFVTWLNGVLIPFLRTACELTDFQAYFVTAAFYISYFVMALPSSLILKKTGFKMGMSVGLWVMAVGAVVFIPAAISRTYGLFLTGLFVQGTGLALLQTAVNPYVTIIGPRESAAKRISIMGIANKFAGVVAPIILASVLLKDSNVIEEKLATSLDAGARAVLLDEMARGVIVPYIIMAIVLVLLGLLIMFVHLPDVNTDAEDEEVGVANVKKTSIWQFPPPPGRSGSLLLRGRRGYCRRLYYKVSTITGRFNGFRQILHLTHDDFYDTWLRPWYSSYPKIPEAG